MTKTKQLEKWTGKFGDDYADRNDFADWKIPLGVEAFRRMIGEVKIESALEVGSNIGLNLMFLSELFKGKVELYGVEPNQKAFARLIAWHQLSLEKAWNCDAFQLPLPDSSVDLVFTCGVLIHISPGDLGRATDEIVRVAHRFVLCVEYFSHTPVQMPYHNQAGLLFKRDFGAFYLDRYPFLKPVNYGFLWQRELPIFDNLNWWLFEKSAAQ